MIATDFWQVVVRPTVHEFYKEPGDIRLKTLAVLTLQAMNEHYYIENEQFPERIYDSPDVGQFKKQLRAAHPFLGTIMDHANAAKHVKERSAKF